MKKGLLYILGVVAMAVALTSCEKEDNGSDENEGDNKSKFNESFFSSNGGKWRDNSTTTLFYRYMADHTGRTWDTDDDIEESEAQNFTWSLSSSDLHQNHEQEMVSPRMVIAVSDGTRAVPKYYVVTELTETTLKYTDAVDKTKKYTFTKVQ